MLPSARSSGAETLAAIVSGLAPGSDALTRIVGKSTCGRGATGSRPYASAPASTTATAIKLLATGRRTKGRERFIRKTLRPVSPRSPWSPAAHDARALADRVDQRKGTRPES